MPEYRMIPEQWRGKKVYSFPYPVIGAAEVAPPVATDVELTKYVQVDYISRLFVEVVGNVTVVGANPAGAATGLDNPEGFLTFANLQTSPQLQGINPVTALTARGLLFDNAFMRGYVRRAVAIPDVAGVHPLYILYEIIFKRPANRKGVEWAHAIGKFKSDLLRVTFGGKDQVIGLSGNTWNFAGTVVNIWTDSDLSVKSNRVHNHELFERTFPIVATQADFPIDTLPQGFLYTDLILLTEFNNVLGNGLINNINLEGGGRVWLPQGDNNAQIIQSAFALQRGVITDPAFAVAGIYPLTLRDGMYTRAIDTLTSPITIKLNVTFTPGVNNVVRMIGRRMVPGAPAQSNPSTKSPSVATR